MGFMDLSRLEDPTWAWTAVADIHPDRTNSTAKIVRSPLFS
jgi:hypothetical protein